MSLLLLLDPVNLSPSLFLHYAFVWQVCSYHISLSPIASPVTSAMYSASIPFCFKLAATFSVAFFLLPPARFLVSGLQQPSKLTYLVDEAGFINSPN